MNEENKDGQKGENEIAATEPSIEPPKSITSEESEAPEIKRELENVLETPNKDEEFDVGRVSNRSLNENPGKTDPVAADEGASPNKLSCAADEKMEVDESACTIEAPSIEPTITSSGVQADDPLMCRLAEAMKNVAEASSPDTEVNIANRLTQHESCQQETSDGTSAIAALSTENLISVLEGSGEKEPLNNVKEAAIPIATCSQQLQPESVPALQEQPSPLPPPKSTRKYIYKLKSKAGKVLRYVSPVPIVLKKPVITLTKWSNEDFKEEEEETKHTISEKVAEADTDDVDSDNSTKENNVKENDASKGAMRIARKRGRPPLSQKAPVITLDDQYSSSDVADSSKEAFKSGGSAASSSSYGIQTRKRQLRFFPDGRLATPANKKYKSAAVVANAAATGSSSADDKKTRDDSTSSDSDILDAEPSDDDSQSNAKTKKPVNSASVGGEAKGGTSTAKKFVPSARSGGSTSVGTEKKNKFARKVFDYESYFREKSTGSASSLSDAQSQSAKKALMPITTPKRIVEIQKSTSVQQRSNTSNGINSSNKNNHNSSATSTPATPTKATVDPVQLLSSLIGVAILPSQLNVVKFKPKTIHERKSMTTQNNISTFVDESVSPSPSKRTETSLQQQQQQQRSTPFKISSKPSLQRILPKPVPSPDRTPTLMRNKAAVETSKSAVTPLSSVLPPRLSSSTPFMKTPFTSSSTSSHHILSPATATAIGSTSAAAAGTAATPAAAAAATEVPKFDNYSDTRVVKTKEGPKKYWKQQPEQAASSEDTKTVYDLVQNVFDRMPSWNLHVIPDTNSLCIAQVSRGRMGIPILKKSIELNSEFAAKVYVHQLHCKRYDGVYDTENKILALIRDIDALAA